MIETVEAPRRRESLGSVAELPETLLKAHAEIVNVLQRIRASRDALESATVGKLHSTKDKLAEVSSATEVAANGILDGLDRAIAFVDELDAIADSDETKAVAVRSSLRDELFQAIGCLQFQDITSQQLNYASSLLGDMEVRLSSLSDALDPNASAIVEPVTAPGLRTFDPGASIHNAEGRQALADSIFETPA
jgi:chemotaxis regulatin CheY-phosphate phosphatase CheZ